MSIATGVQVHGGRAVPPHGGPLLVRQLPQDARRSPAAPAQQRCVGKSIGNLRNQIYCNVVLKWGVSPSAGQRHDIRGPGDCGQHRLSVLPCCAAALVRSHDVVSAAIGIRLDINHSALYKMKQTTHALIRFIRVLSHLHLRFEPRSMPPNICDKAHQRLLLPS